MINITVVTFFNWSCFKSKCDSIILCVHLSEQGGGIVPESRLTVSHGADQLWSNGWAGRPVFTCQRLLSSDGVLRLFSWREGTSGSHQEVRAPLCHLLLCISAVSCAKYNLLIMTVETFDYICKKHFFFFFLVSHIFKLSFWLQDGCHIYGKPWRNHGD